MTTLLGLDEIAQRLRQAPQVVAGWHYFTNELPPPDAVVDTEPVWDCDAIDAWAAQRAVVRSLRQLEENAR